MKAMVIGIGAVICIAVAGLHAQSPPIESGTRTPMPTDVMGRQYGAMSLKRPATDPDYSFTEKRPVMVKGGFGEGGHNVYRFLNALRGPTGQPVRYSRVGTCCKFKTKQSPFGDGEELLEVYEVWYEGGTPKRMYFNWYDDGDILVPVGFSTSK
jgi:hypothetical protein